MSELDTNAFENVKNQIGHCAIWCGSCVVGNGTLKELTKRYEHLIDGYGIDKWGAVDQGFDGHELMELLQLIKNMPICQGCLKGGGKAGCEIRFCATGKKLADCIECGESETCKNREAVHNVREGALKVGMMIKTNKNQKKLTEKWITEAKDKWPSCILFMKES